MTLRSIPFGIRVVVGLGNPGQQFYYQRHSIGFRVLDSFAHKFDCEWKKKDNFLYAQSSDFGFMLLKPQTFMNNSGHVCAYLKNKGIIDREVLIVHDELERPFGFVGFSFGGSHKGHNGLKSIIQFFGNDFWRLKIGIGRPLDKELVPEYVLQPFSENNNEVDEILERATNALVGIIN